MKRMIFSGCIIVLLASVVYVSYGEMQKTSISEANLADLKGKWTGYRSPGAGMMLNTDLEISSEGLPVQGKLTYYDVRRPGQSGTTETIGFKSGKINDNGNLLIMQRNLELELSLYNDGGKLKLEGNFSLPGAKGTMSFKKK